MYSQNDGGWVDEDSPTEPDSFSGRRLLEAEQILAASPFGTVSLRLGGIYGPGRTGLIDRVRASTLDEAKEQIRRGNTVLSGRKSSPFNLLASTALRSLKSLIHPEPE